MNKVTSDSCPCGSLSLQGERAGTNVLELKIQSPGSNKKQKRKEGKREVGGKRKEEQILCVLSGL